jgi:hypothetical protein
MVGQVRLPDPRRADRAVLRESTVLDMAVSAGGLVSFDCADPRALGEFWAAMLGGELIRISDDIMVIRTEWVWMSALRVPDYVAPTWPAGDVPQQIHVDLAVTDLEAAVAGAEQLGARPATFQPSPDRWRVLIDPAGHPFCLTTQIPPQILQRRPTPPATA